MLKSFFFHSYRIGQQRRITNMKLTICLTDVFYVSGMSF